MGLRHQRMFTLLAISQKRESVNKDGFHCLSQQLHVRYFVLPVPSAVVPVLADLVNSSTILLFQLILGHFQ